MTCKEDKDQAQKIVNTTRSGNFPSEKNQPSSASVVSMYGQERPSISSLHQQLAGASGTQAIQLGGIGAGSTSAECFSLEAEVKDKLEEARRQFPIRSLRCLK